MAKCKPAGALHFGELTGRGPHLRTSARSIPPRPPAPLPDYLHARLAYQIRLPRSPPTDRSHHMFFGPEWYDFIMERAVAQAGLSETERA